jgi:hypothetical protein
MGTFEKRNKPTGTTCQCGRLEEKGHQFFRALKMLPGKVAAFFQHPAVRFGWYDVG